MCIVGRASVFHCGVSEPPTAMNPATRGLQHALVEPERDHRLLARLAHREQLLDDGAVGVRARAAGRSAA